MTAQFDIISDTHFEMHLGFGQALEERFDHIFMPLFERSKRADHLIIAGDLGEHNDQTLEALRLIRDKAGYANIVMVPGNHDLFLPNRIAMDDYGTSKHRIAEFRQAVADEDGMHLLEGDVVEIDGVRIGGTMGWYDGRYVYHNLNPCRTKNFAYLNRLYDECNPDSHHIIGLGLEERFDALLADELAKIEAIHQDVDIMVTHINPSIKEVHTQREFRRADSTGFFTFDGTSYLVNGSMKYWVFGHQHCRAEFERHGVKLVCNAFGSPGEHHRNFTLKSIGLDG